MGIIGLFSFMKENRENLLLPYKLKNCTLIIDGNNVFNAIYNNAQLDCLFGGDYRKVHQICVDFLKNLLQCNVRPIVIFDGSRDNSVKWSKLIARHQERIKVGMKILWGNKTKTSTPLFATKVFMNALKSLRVEFYQCDGDADKFVANLANMMQCPMFSGDGDFFMFDLKWGFVLHDWDKAMCQPITNNDETYIESQIYFVDNLLKLFPSLDRRVLPLFPVLLGNDFLDGDIRDKINRHIFPTAEVFSDGKILKVGEWLSKRTRENVMEEILRAADFQNDQQNINKALQKAISMYDCTTDAVMDFDIKSRILQTTTDIGFPHWLSEKYCTGDAPSFLPYLFTDGKIRIPILLEDFTQNSIFHCCVSLRQIAYSILLQNDNSHEIRDVNEYIRKGEIVVEEVVPLKCDDYPSLDGVTSFELKERKQLFYKYVSFKKKQIDLIETFPPNLQLFACTTFLWCIIENYNGNKPLVDALLVGSYGLILSSDQCYFPLTPNVRKAISDAVLKYNFVPDVKTNGNNNDNTLPSVVHKLNQWQAILNCLELLNVALNYPLENVHIEDSFSGPLFFNLNNMFSRCKSFSSALERIGFNWRDMQCIEQFRNLFLDGYRP